jgi:hypothetical protein
MAGSLCRPILRITAGRISECVVSAISLKWKQMTLNPDLELYFLQSFALSRGMAEQFWPMNLHHLHPAFTTWEIEKFSVSSSAGCSMHW